MPTQLTPTSGLSATGQAAAADATGNYVVPGANPSGFVVRINNGSGASITVDLDDVTTTSPEGAGTPATPWPDVRITVPAGAARYIVLPRSKLSRFLNPANGRVSWTYSAVTTVTVDVIGIS